MKLIKSILMFIIIFILFTVLGYFLTDKVFMPIFVGAYKTDISVPNFVGISKDSAEVLANKYKLKLIIEDKDFNSQYGIDTIFYQDPAPNNFVKEGRSIRVRVSKGGRVLSMPYLFGLDYKAAVSRINQYGFTLGRVIEEYNDSVETDLVFKSAPKYGDVIMKGSPVDIWVSKGSRNKVVQVPLFINSSVNNAVLEAKKLGLEIGNISKTVVDSVVPETVIGQSLPVGAKVPGGSKINFIISSME